MLIWVGSPRTTAFLKIIPLKLISEGMPRQTCPAMLGRPTHCGDCKRGVVCDWPPAGRNDLQRRAVVAQGELKST